MLISDAAIVKLRRLLLQAVRDHQDGKPLMGIDPRSYRVRSIRCEQPRGFNMPEAMGELVRVDQVVGS